MGKGSYGAKKIFLSYYYHRILALKQLKQTIKRVFT